LSAHAVRLLVLIAALLMGAGPVAQQLPPPRPKPKPTAPAPAERKERPQATLLITADMAATISVDAKEIGAFAQDEVRTIPVGVGQHLVRAVAGDLKWEHVVTVDKVGQMVVRTGLVELKAQREKNQPAAAAPTQPPSAGNAAPKPNPSRATGQSSIKGLTRDAVIEQLGPPSQNGDGLSADKNSFIYDTIEFGRFYVYFRDDSAVFWFPGDFPLDRLKGAARAPGAQPVRVGR